MSVTLSDKVVAAAFVALLVAGAVTAYLLVYDEVNGDPREDPHSYTFEGTLLGEPCSGTGQTVFVEHSGGLILHTLSFSVSSTSSSIERSIDIIFDEDGEPDDSFERVGDTVVDDTEASVWRMSSDGVGIVLWTDRGCRILRMEIASADFDLTGCIQ